MNCSRCGFPLGNQQGYCPRCGAPYVPTGVYVPPSVSSSADRLRKARVGVVLICLFLGIILFASLKPVAGGLAVVALIIFAAGWSMPTITYQRKVVFVIASLAVIIGAETIEVSISRAHEAERQKQLAQVEAQKEAESRQAAQQAENDFKNMTPAQHLSAAQSDLHIGASEDRVTDGMKQLGALNGTPMEGRAKALLARYQAEKAKADKVAAAEAATAEARQEKETAEATEEVTEKNRIETAKDLDEKWMSIYANMEVTAAGPKHTTLQIYGPDIDRDFEYNFHKQLGAAGTLNELASMGFKKVVLSNGDVVWTIQLR